MWYTKSNQNHGVLRETLPSGVVCMYFAENKDQLVIADFILPFGGKLDPENRWVRFAEIMPWDHIEEIYLRTMSVETGRRAFSSRIAFGAIFIKEYRNLTDEECVAEIQENPYMQYFLGLHEFRQAPLFDPSMMVHFRKRFPVEDVARVNEYVCTGKWPEDGRNVDRNDGIPEVPSEVAPVDEDKQEDDKSSGGKPSKGKRNPNTAKRNVRKKKKNRGKLIMDATVAPSDIKYPTDIDLLNQCREHYETAIDHLWVELPHKGHKLPYSAKKARKSYLNIAKSKKWTAKKLRKAIGEQLDYIEKAQKQFEQFRLLAPDVKFPYWLSKRLEVVPLVYAQQKEMYENHTHSCKDRIVSLEQPFVRPIQRGKRPNPTEFGQKLHLSVVDGYTFLEQTSWNNFNEGSDLQAVAEDYRRKFGVYPEAILADKIYQTRANRGYCKERGIRLSGPALGRRKDGDTGAKQSRQMYKDSCERNAVEGRNGNLKRRYGLDLIMSKLEETAKTEAALNILAMNVAYRLRRWLYLLFRFWRLRLVFQ